MQVEARSARRGVIRSSLQPEETAGLTRSGDLSRMLPFEAHLLAAGWPRDSADGEPLARPQGSRSGTNLSSLTPTIKPTHACTGSALRGR